jgi:hypothetical protein
MHKTRAAADGSVCTPDGPRVIRTTLSPGEVALTALIVEEYSHQDGLAPEVHALAERWNAIEARTV